MSVHIADYTQGVFRKRLINKDLWQSDQASGWAESMNGTRDRLSGLNSEFQSSGITGFAFAEFWKPQA